MIINILNILLGFFISLTIVGGLLSWKCYRDGNGAALPWVWTFIAFTLYLSAGYIVQIF